jgi:hypothetical protein
MRNDARVREQGTTMHAFSEADAATPRGRYPQDTAVVGSKADIAGAYGACSPALAVQLPDELPLGYSVDELEPSTGLFHSPVEQLGGPDATPLSGSSLSQPNSAPAAAAPSPVDDDGVGLGPVAAQCMSQMSSSSDQGDDVRIERPPTFRRRV